MYYQRWELLKENKNSTKKAIKKKGRKHALDQKSDQEKAITVKKKKKEYTISTKKKENFLFYKFPLLNCASFFDSEPSEHYDLG